LAAIETRHRRYGVFVPVTVGCDRSDRRRFTIHGVEGESACLAGGPDVAPVTADAGGGVALRMRLGLRCSYCCWRSEPVILW